MYLDDGERPNERANEPEVLRKLSKHAIFKLLASTYILPEEHCRAVNRRYLVRVYSNEVFRLNRLTLLDFESRLTLEEQVRSSNQSVANLVEKANRILNDHNELQLGFEGNCLPDEHWIYRVVRYIDPYNVTGSFKKQE